MKGARVGYVNRHSQEVIRKTPEPGTNPPRYVYVLRCRRCGHMYDANIMELRSSKCPKCQSAMTGPSNRSEPQNPLRSGLSVDLYKKFLDPS